MKYEIFFYENDTEMLIDQGAQAVKRGAGKDWAVVYSGDLKGKVHKLLEFGIVIPTYAMKIVIIQNREV